MPLKSKRLLTEFTVEAVDQYLREHVPALVEQSIAQSLHGSDQDLPEWLRQLLDKHLNRYCAQFVDQRLGDVLLTELKLSQERILSHLSKEIQGRMDKVIHQAFAK